MNKIEKFLKRLESKKRILAEEIIKKIISQNTDGLDVKKLRGYDYIYRVRKGSLRIMYYQKDSETTIIEIAKRNDNTYSDY